MLRNLPAKHTTESAIAAAQLLPHLPAAHELLTHPDAVPALVAAFLQEHSEACIDTLAGDCKLSNEAVTSKTCQVLLPNLLLVCKNSSGYNQIIRSTLRLIYSAAQDYFSHELQRSKIYTDLFICANTQKTDKKVTSLSSNQPKT